MCIAILNSTTTLSKEHLENSWDNNNQGAGLLYNINGKLTVFKTYDKKQFINEYYKIRAAIKGKIVLHFRIATSGFEKYTNLHPFLVNQDLGFVHNGIISGLGNQQHSDTYHFNEMLKGFKHDFINCDMTKLFIADYIGSSKLVFLDSNDNATIINEDKGHWDGDNWFSNDSYKSYSEYLYYGNQKVSRGKSSFTKDWSTDFEDLFPEPEWKEEYDMGGSFTEILDEDEFNQYISNFRNVTENTVSNLEIIIGCSRYSSEFYEEIENAAFEADTLDLNKIYSHISKVIAVSYKSKPAYN